jgi:hypothetical protein
MGSAKRGALAVLGIVSGFLTLVFLSQMFRYMTPALYGDQMSLGMWGIYVVLTYTGASVAIVSFMPRTTTAKYLGGAGGAVAAGLVLTSLYLFTIDLASGMMLLIITGGQVTVAGLVYGIAVSRENDRDSSVSEPEPTHTSEPESESERESGPSSEPTVEQVEPEPEPEPENTHNARDASDTQGSHPESNTATDTETGTGRSIDWRTGGQIFAGVVVFLIGIPITVASPIGVPLLVLGLALIPHVRSWSMQKLGRSSTAD